ncbi:protein transport protein Sec16 [Ditylenchus destructor]|uniref:Protein transport protein Sec16 n=1 Tax=Ditylenchus destructor TaxID=166010 RepID=A0AAD4R6T1_9BILA|nr:protein transport protein Sec16 [Ditylenchus destructor]
MPEAETENDQESGKELATSMSKLTISARKSEPLPIQVADYSVQGASKERQKGGDCDGQIQEQDNRKRNGIWTVFKEWFVTPESKNLKCTEMHLPDDKSPKIVWNEVLKRYVGEGTEELESVPPPSTDLPQLNMNPFDEKSTISFRATTALKQYRYYNAFDN